jgi:hypothetical protein
MLTHRGRAGKGRPASVNSAVGREIAAAHLLG